MTDQEIQARVGTVVDRWTLQRLVGRGGMAAVYEGLDDEGNRAAVKVLHDEYVGRGAIQRRFLREAFIMGVSKHPSAIKVYGQGLANGTPFFAMQYVEGETMQSRWAAVGAMAPAEVIGYAKSLLEILASYHTEGVVHRDIKPANILIAGSGVRLIDFGVARYRDMGTAVAEYTRDGATLGTPPFMAPEQAMGKIDRIDQRSDIFAVGALMYALLTAQFVHRGATNDEMLVVAASKAAESVIVAAPHLPDELVKIVDKALSFYPNDRYEDAGEMHAALVTLSAAPAAPKFATGSAAAAGGVAAEPEPKRVDPLASPLGDPALLKKAAALAVFGADAFETTHTNVTEAVETMFHGLRRVFDAAHLYDFQHPEVERRIDESFELVTQILHEYPDDCAFQVRMATFDVDGTPVWRPKPPFDQIPYRMFSNGLRLVRLVPGLSHSELRQFLNLITQPAAELATEDDIVTALWDLDLEHVQTTMVSSFTIAEDVQTQRQFELELRDAVESEEEYLRKEGQALIELLALVADTGAGGLAQAQMTARDAAIEYRLSGATYASRFREQFVDALGRDTWELRSALVVSAAIQEAWTEHDLARMAAMVTAILPRYLLQERDSDGLQLADRVVRTTSSADVRRRVSGWLLPAPNVARLMLRLSNAKNEWDDETRRRASTLLAEAPADGVDEVLPLFAALPANSRRVVMTFLMRNATGKQAEYGALAVNSSADVARDMVQVLERVDDEATPRALIQMIEHPDESVREAILSALSKRFPTAVEEVLLPMINDDSPNIRVRALRLARSLKSEVIRGALLNHIDSGKFHSLPFTERRLTVETLQAIDPQLAEQACVEIAGKKLNLTLDQAVHTTRVMALTFLGEFGVTRAGWEALEDSCKRRPGNPQNVRDAAEAALARWRSRAE